MTHTDIDTLEVISRTPAKGKKAKTTPLLFVHGAYAAAWCWEEHYLDFFAAAGYHAHAVSLSGHGKSRGREHLDTLSITDYAKDLREIAKSFDTPPVLIGHSMGGFVVQKYLERHQAPGAVLMCSVPPQGLMASAVGLLFSKPTLMTDLNQLMSGNSASMDTLREALFAQPVAVDDLERYFRHSQRESHRAIWDMTLFNLPSVSRVKETPLLVQGAEFDHLIPVSLVEMTARSYGVEPHIFMGMGHGLMLERDWKKPAQQILDWLKELEL
jgi:non-heme chloroperoxidase